jgi:hypothetical protein
MIERVCGRMCRFPGIVCLLALAMLGPSFALPAPRVSAQPAPAAVVTAVGPDGAPVPGACFMTLDRDSAAPFQRYGNGGANCDGADGAADGSTAITYPYQAGAYVLYQVTAAEGYQVGASTTFDYVEGQTAQLTIQQKLGGQTLTITTSVDGGGTVTQGCFTLSRDNARAAYRTAQPTAWRALPVCRPAISSSSLRSIRIFTRIRSIFRSRSVPAKTPTSTSRLPVARPVRLPWRSSMSPDSPC